MRIKYLSQVLYSPPQTEDKVAAAMASNPKLAALFDHILSDDEEEEDNYEHINTVVSPRIDKPIDEDTPLFVSDTQSGLVNDMGAYIYDDDDEDKAIHQVIARIYENESTPQIAIEKDKASYLSLDANDFYDLWVSRIPDAYMYMYSLNDEYKKILKQAVEEEDPDKIKRDLLSVRKQIGKTNEQDELALEALQFKQDFLESVIEWRAKQAPEYKHMPDEVKDDKPSPSVGLTKDTIMTDKEDEEIQFTTGSTQGMIVSDDEDDQDIQFIENMPELTEPRREVVHPIDEHVHINIHQSILHLDNSLDIDKGHVNDAIKGFETSNTVSEQKVDLPRNKDIDENKKISEILLEDDTESEMLIKSSAPVDLEQPIKNTEEHGYNSEDELDPQGEEDEFVRFVSDIQSKHLDQVRTELHQDMKHLNKQKRKEMGNADDITDQMVQDIQELLKMFGIPYVVSPMEAEAQCATLETLGLIDGTVTDDSDVFLFGASRVFKNMFNQHRFVECYMSQDIEREMSLSRKKLIQLAFLLGSDYTEGIPGVGPVAAMEILAEFDKSNSEEANEEEALQLPLERFKDWYNSGIDETSFQKKFVKYPCPFA